jgi:hypothetical protein
LKVTVGDAGLVNNGDGSWYKNFTLPAPVKPGSTFIQQACRESRIPALPEPALTLEHRGAAVELFDANTVRLRWNGALATDIEAGNETISVAIEVFDLDNLGDDIQELLFRTARALGYLGENVMNDLLLYDQAGNVVQYRLRVFSSRTNCEAATPDLPDGSAMQTGEYARVTMNQDIEISKNDRALMLRVLTDIIATPGVS